MSLAMRVMVNGEARELRDGLTVAELVGELGLQARRIAVELNLDVLPRDDFSARTLRDGDAVEIVQFVGGG